MTGLPVPSKRRAPTNAFTLAEVPVCPELLEKTKTSKTARSPRILLMRVIRSMEFSLAEPRAMTIFDNDSFDFTRPSDYTLSIGMAVCR
jgi:hypothetical protein